MFTQFVLVLFAMQLNRTLKKMAMSGASTIATAATTTTRAT